MSINIGNGNKINNSTIAEKIDGNEGLQKRKNFFDRHPVICSLLISLLAGFILLFHFWQDIVTWIEGLF